MEAVYKINGARGYLLLVTRENYLLPVRVYCYRHEVYVLQKGLSFIQIGQYITCYRKVLLCLYYRGHIRERASVFAERGNRKRRKGELLYDTYTHKTLSHHVFEFN